MLTTNLLSPTTPNCSNDSFFEGTRGPREADVIFVGEAWGVEEAAARRPFVGTSGKELDRILHDAGLGTARILFTNLVSIRPPTNDFTHFLFNEKEKLNAQHRGIRCRPVLLDGIRRLHDLIALVRPKLVVAAGNWPLWALTDVSDISTTAGFRTPKGIVKWRGSQLFTSPSIHPAGGPPLGPLPVLPIIHPASILREWGYRSITVHDLRARAGRFLVGSCTWSAPTRTLAIHTPSFRDVCSRLDFWLRRAAELHPRDNLERRDGGERDSGLQLAVDLETWKRKFISVVGLADADVELCIPLFSVVNGAVTNRFTPAEETGIWERLKLLLEHPNVKIIGQNFIYDTEWLHRFYNIKALVSFDTMVAHHLLYPGTPKRLDYLASLYCEHFSYWKDESWDLDGDIGEHTWRYNCKDLRATYEIAQTLRDVIKQQGMEELYTFQMEQWKLSRSLMLTGTTFDLPLQKAMKLSLLEEANQLSEWLLNVVPESWAYTSTGKPWFDSPKGTADLLYTALGLTPIRPKKQNPLKLDRVTVDDKALQELSERREAKWLGPLFERLRHLRSIGVFTSHFLDARISPDGRIRCSFNIAHPETFRWSSNSNGFGEGTNLQNIPKGDKDPTAFTEGETDPDDPGTGEAEEAENAQVTM